MRPDDLHEKRLLLSPLNWGMGHVSRCIGLIHELKMQGNTLIVACDERQEGIFRQYFTDITFERHEGYPFNFKGKGHFALDLMRSSSGLKARLHREREETEALVTRHAIDMVISDHRYGFFSAKVPSVFVTHQFNLPVSWLQKPVDRYHKKLMRTFDHVWILDDSNQRLAGKLSNAGADSRVKYIGPRSRFSLYDLPQKSSDVTVAVISGPDVYAQQLIPVIQESFPEALLVCSEHLELPESASRVEGNWRQQDAVILNASRIVSRSGYSTVMDVAILGIDAVYFPTPGQAEQKYLWEQHSKRKH